MRHKIILFLFIFLTILLLSCTKEVPNNSEFKPQPFITGVLENENGHTVVNVQTTVALNKTSIETVNNASITLYSRRGDESPVLITDSFNVENGIYTSADRIQPKIGNYYWIEVVLNDDTIILSNEEKLKEKVIIKDFILSPYYTVFFEDSAEDINFYLVEFMVLDINNNVIEKISEVSNDILFNGDKNASIKTLTTFSTSEVVGSVRVEVSNINFSTYQFYNNKFNQSYNQNQRDVADAESAGDPTVLFLPPPPNLIGNLKEKNTSDIVLGFFGVYTSSQQQLKID